MNKVLYQDKIRYGNEKLPLFQKYYRKAQCAKNIITKMIYKSLFVLLRNKKHIQLSIGCVIGEGLYFGHPYCITINPRSKIGTNCNIHKGVTIGQENRGSRKGTPQIGNDVWIGINSIIVGNITIGNDVLIAPNSFVNKNIPSHSIVFGNPCMIKPVQNAKATEGYINHRC